MPLDTIYLPQRTKEHLTKLKRLTGLEHWNEICRLGFCISLGEETPPRDIPGSDRAIEMTWDTFGGRFSHIYEALLRKEAEGNLDDRRMAKLAVRHICRGVSRLAARKSISSIGDVYGEL